ncbi:MAG: OmpA family protein [Undibacterium sp.]|nr:OmpA family protein [Opitutaceae bacterium]
MKLVSKPFLLLAISAAVLVSGCTKKPVRPSPDATVLGPQTGGNFNPTDIATSAEPNSGLQERVGGDGVIDDGHTIRGLLGAVYFELDRSDITKPEERAKLQAAKDYLAKNPEQRLLLEGHADWRGSSEYNLGLGDRRANAAKKYLGTIGVGAGKLETLSKGSEEAKKSGTDEEMKKDRRVELVIIKKQ